MALEAINPMTGQVMETYPEMTPEDVDQYLRASEAAFTQWRETSGDVRSGVLRRAAEVLRAQKDHLARLMAEEMGKPVQQGRAEIEKCAWVCEYYAQEASKFLAPEMIESDAVKSYAAFVPLGPVLAVMPWNFPFWQVFRFCAPALMAGNAAVLKHASNVPGCAVAIEQVLRQAGLPENVFRTFLVSSSAVEGMITHPVIRAVTLTGSTPAGKAVAAQAGACLKKTVLELGGSDPSIICEDADLDHAVAQCVTSRLINAGQSCIAAKRFLVLRSLLKDFQKKFVQEMTSRVVGDPLQEETEVGPMARKDLRDELHRQVEASVKSGARCLCGGEIPEGEAAFYPPTVLTEVKPGMPAFDEELFGPVAAIVPVKDEEEALKLANATSFGLGASIYTRDQEKGERWARDRIEAGCCFVNAFVKSDPRLPFGGIKASGYGRELSVFGIREFVNIKTVYVANDNAS